MSESNDGFVGLSLSLGSPPATGKNSNGFEPPTHSANFPLNLLHPHQNSPNILRSSLEGRRWERGGIDINQPAMTAEWDDNVVASSPHSTASTVTGKRSEMEFEAAAAEMEMTTSSMEEEEEEDGGDDAAAAAAARKKLRLTKEQAAVLEDTFRGHNTLNPKQKAALAKQLNLKARQVEVWFQNRRARTKLKQTEIDCEYLRRCCERLADENRRLHKEVNDLRALKLSPHLYMNMSPPTTLIMCPQCQLAPLSTPPPPSSASSVSISAVGRRQIAAAPPPGLIQWTAILKPHRPQL